VTAADLIRRRETDWRRLAALSEGRAGRAVAPEQAPVLARLYRAAVADLGRLRTLAAAETGQEDDGATVEWLNRVVARAHGKIYGGGAELSSERLRGFLARELPRRVRAAWRRILLAFAVFAVAGAVAFGLGAGDAAVARSLAGEAAVRNAEAFRALGDGGRALADSAVMSSFYVTNNTKVAFVSFAAGVSAGLGTLAIMVTNGAGMGVTLALVGHHGSTANLFAFIAAHGPIELFAIFMAAAAGLGMGHALIVPGAWSRAVAFRRAAADAVYLAIGAGALMAVAALFEAFVSPSTLPPVFKAAVGLANAVALAMYFTLAGRSAAPTAAQPPAPSAGHHHA